MTEMTPREIVQELDKHIVGQQNAKRAVAIALRNRWRRMHIKSEIMRQEVMPKNILLIGPTGVGKTEIARRLARLAHAPFIKVEATKFTEVGYVGRDVESIIRDLMEVAMKEARLDAMKKVAVAAKQLAEERVLDVLIPPASGSFVNAPPDDKQQATRGIFRQKLHQGDLDDKEIEIEVSAMSSLGVEIMAPPGMEEMTSQLQSMFQNLGQDRSKHRKMTVKQALKVLQEEESMKLINDEDLKVQACDNVEQNGMVFIDEIDKVTKRSDHAGADVSREGVQRDLLPLVEGSTVSTKYGMVKTDHILFIASGAFHVARPSDLIPELQGRFPIRVELDALTADDFERILKEPDASLTEQYVALLATENYDLQFTDTGVQRMAEIAWHINETTENIGARRLHTVMERLLEELTFSATDSDNNAMKIDNAYVDRQLANFVENEDLARYIL